MKEAFRIEEAECMIVEPQDTEDVVMDVRDHVGILNWIRKRGRTAKLGESESVDLEEEFE